jgi:hypothetical protein
VTSKTDLFYVATPYSRYEGGIEQAYIDACKLTGKLLKEGWRCYSPIAHTHGIAIHANLDPLDHNIWLPFDEAIMGKADGLIVAMMEGWAESKGVAHEIEFFKKAGKPIVYLDPVTLAFGNIP